MSLGATEHFTALVRAPEEQLRLDEAVLWLAAHAEPDLDVPAQLARLDELAARCPAPTLEGIRELLFDQVGLRGNTVDYTDPRNSFLDQVLDRRLGIPISLSVLTMEIGRRVGVELEGIGMPGHFLVRASGSPSVLIDPFHGGRLLEVAQCEDLFRSLFGPEAPFSPALLEVTRGRTILSRMLANLKASYAERADPESLVWVSRLRAAIPGVPAGELAELARRLVNVGRFGEAADTVEELAELDAASGDDLRRRAARLRARLN